MKKSILKYAAILPILICSIGVFAQRGGGGGNHGGGGGGSRGGGGGGSFSAPSRGGGGSFSAPSRSYNNGGPSASFRQPSAASQSRPNMNYAPSNRSYGGSYNGGANVNRSYSPTNRGSYSTNSYSPTNRGGNGYSTSRSYAPSRGGYSPYNGSRNYVGSLNNRYAPIGRGGFGRYYGSPRFATGVPYYGQRFSSLGHGYLSIGFGGYNYGYYNGIFYRPYGGYYQVCYPPFGIRIGALPLGYYSFYYGGMPYYYYNGVYYNNYGSNEYQVVEPPLGAKLPNLPAGAKPVTINDQNYYELNGTYYVAEYNSNNEVLYEVVGTNGTLDESKVAEINAAPIDDQPQAQSQTYAQPQSAAGAIYKTLPPDCKHVTINGQDLYESPDNVYYQEIVNDNGTVSYQVVGNPNP